MTVVVWAMSVQGQAGPAPKSEQEAPVASPVVKEVQEAASVAIETAWTDGAAAPRWPQR
jgi:hypothetical protein